MDKRPLKDLLYEQVARIGKAVSSPKRLELLELLAQGEKTVAVLASELSIDIKLASAHLKGLREARLVQSRRDGKYMVYRLSGPDVAQLWVTLRLVAAPDKLAQVGRSALLEQARRGEVIVIDVRPRQEYQAAHLPRARSMPLPELARFGHWYLPLLARPGLWHRGPGAGPGGARHGADGGRVPVRGPVHVRLWRPAVAAG